MKLITFLSDQDFAPKGALSRNGYKIRLAGRVFMTNDKDEVALMWIEKEGIYKLPGGGIENEVLHDGIRREVLEETGCQCSIGEEIGLVIEFRDEWQMCQLSYCYMAVVTEDMGTNNFTDEEKERGFALRWIPREKVIEVMEGNMGQGYDVEFMQKRDLEIVRAAMKK